MPFPCRKPLLVLATALALAAALAVAPPARAADRFYEDLLRDGIQAAERGDAVRAAKLLRLACFGLLEEPPVLGRCLIHLGLTQAAADDDAAFRTTFERVVEVERRFAGYTRAEVSPTVRKRFESALVDLVSAQALESSGAFRRLVPDSAGVEAPVDEPSPVPQEPPPPPALPGEVAAAIAQARDLGGSGTRDVLARELERLRPLAEKYPRIPELQHLAAELAYRLRRWSESRDYFERGGEIDPDQPVLLFYYSVVLYETDDKERAAEVLKRCLPRLRRNEFIDDYAAKILD